jgi:hypothetical protein
MTLTDKLKSLAEEHAERDVARYPRKGRRPTRAAKAFAHDQATGRLKPFGNPSADELRFGKALYRVAYTTRVLEVRAAEQRLREARHERRTGRPWIPAQVT